MYCSFLLFISMAYFRDQNQSPEATTSRQKHPITFSYIKSFFSSPFKNEGERRSNKGR